MTKNNLREHLSWLLKSATASLPQSTSSGILDAVTLLEPDSGSVSTQNAESPVVSSFKVSERCDNAISLDAESLFARPKLPASLLNAQSRDEMARLQSGPKSSHKSRLLSESIPSLQASAPSSVRGSSNSLTAQYNRGISGEYFTSAIVPPADCLQTPARPRVLVSKSKSRNQIHLPVLSLLNNARQRPAAIHWTCQGMWTCTHPRRVP